MKGITVEPHKPQSARLEEIPEPDARGGSVLLEAIAVGVCGTDAEIVEGKYGWAPPGKTRLVLGHESLGRVVDPGSSSALHAGDLVVGIVRRPDPVPCPNCAVGEWDMCRNGQYTERGIKEIDGFMSERWRIEPDYAMKIDRSLGLLGVLLEPTTVVTKAWEQVIAIGHRAYWEPRRVLVTGAGPIGLLAALIGKQRGLEVHVGQVIKDAITGVDSGGIVCLTGVGTGGSAVGSATADIAAAAVLKNNVVVGSVNANKRHWYKAGQILARADREWLAHLITRSEPPEAFARALQRQPEDIKVVIQFAEA
jgi:threonine dehydrogenase-like Zn-dependent dehydrogenase